jgi:hypothetical protein
MREFKEGRVNFPGFMACFGGKGSSFYDLPWREKSGERRKCRRSERLASELLPISFSSEYSKMLRYPQGIPASVRRSWGMVYLTSLYLEE